MLKSRLAICGAAAVLLAAPAFAHKEEKGTPISKDQLPAAVQTSLDKEAKGQPVEEIRMETEKNGKTRYEAEVISSDGKKGTNLEFDSNGKLVKRSTHSEAKEKEEKK